jgi:hypothetical protein
VEVKESTLQAAQQAQRAGANKQETKQDNQFRDITKMIFCKLECRPKFSKQRVGSSRTKPKHKQN